MFSVFETFGFSRSRAIAFVVLAAILVVAPFGIYQILLMQVMCYALFAMGANLLMGFIGLLSLGQAAYFGVGAYAAGYTMLHWGLTPELGVLLGGISGALLGAIFGWLAIRRTTIYFTMITLALAQIAYFFAVQLPGITGGENGIQNIPRGALLGLLPLASDRVVYVVIAVLFLVGVFFVHRVMHSPFGQVVKAIRENEQRAISLGYHPDQYKWMIFILAGFLAGIAGGCKVIVMGFATL